jgi:DNA-binding SARP family transcriptional activator
MMLFLDAVGGMADGGTSQRAELALLGCFGLRVNGAPVALAPASQRLLAYVALVGRTVRRDGVAGALWSGEPEDRAHTNLRSAVARLRAGAADVLRARGPELVLAEALTVDLHDVRRVALDVIARPSAAAAEAAARAVPLLSAELLPGWYEDWVVHEAEAWRQLRLHALEALSRQLAAAGRHGEAVVAAQAAVSGDPLRETAHAVLIDAHLREGNRSEAVRAFERYRRRLRDELGLEPTPSLRAAVGHAAVT